MQSAARCRVVLVAFTVSLVAVVLTAGAAAQTSSGHKRLVIDRTVISPDGKRVAYLAHLVPRDLPVESIRVKTLGGTTRIVYRSSDSCCGHVLWLSPTRLVFDDDYRVTTLDVTNGRVQRIAGFSNFTVSPDHKWIAGWADSGGHRAQTVGVVRADGSGCRVVPTPPSFTDLDAFFSKDGVLHVLRSPFSTQQNITHGPTVWLEFSPADLSPAFPRACFT